MERTMHANTTLEPRLECYGADYALLRPDTDAATAYVPRHSWPTFVVATETVYRVAAPTAERVLQWFADKSDTDLDVVTIDFGTVEVIGQVVPEPEDPRYVLTAQGRRALAMALLFDQGPAVGAS
jgi:hypothetical protein